MQKGFMLHSETRFDSSRRQSGLRNRDRQLVSGEERYGGFVLAGVFLVHPCIPQKVCRSEVP